MENFIKGFMQGFKAPIEETIKEVKMLLTSEQFGETVGTVTFYLLTIIVTIIVILAIYLVWVFWEDIKTNLKNKISRLKG